MLVLSRGRLATVASALLLALAGICWAACFQAPQTPAQAPVPAPTATTANDPLALLSPANPAPPPSSRFPELAWTEFSEGLPKSGTWLGYPKLFDFTGDGRADLVASNREEDGYNSWMSVEKGPWVLRIADFPRDMGYGPAEGADMNSDGIPDLVISAHSNGIRIFLNDGQMKWTESAPVENPDLVLDVAVGKLNADAFPDVVGISHFKGGIGVYLGDGKGGLQRLSESAALIHDKVFGRDAQLIDLDSDGFDDIVVTTNEGLKAFLTRQGKPMTWEAISAGLPRPSIGNSIYAVVAAQFIPDGWPELAVCKVPNPIEPPAERNEIGLYAWRAEAKRWEQIDRGLERSATYRDVRSADFNRDGHLDLLTMSVENGALFYLGDGKGGFTPKGRLPAVHGKARCALGDIDGNGWTDVAVAVGADKDSPQSGGLRSFLNKPEIWN